MRPLLKHKLSWIFILLAFQLWLACKNANSPSPSASPISKPDGIQSQPGGEEEYPDLEGFPKPKSPPESADQMPQPTPTAPASLPTNFAKAIDDCKAQNRYYDLALGSCTMTPLAEFTCDLAALLSEGSTVLNGVQKTKLKEYVDANLVGYSLFACTMDTQGPRLHFYKVEADRVRAHNVSITP